MRMQNPRWGWLAACFMSYFSYVWTGRAGVPALFWTARAARNDLAITCELWTRVRTMNAFLGWSLELC